MTYVIGLTGGIGSGKSTVATLFQELGATIIDSDIISHDLTQSGGIAIEPIRQAFGNVAIDSHGALNRAHMRKLIFSDADAKLCLEAILHPLINAQLGSQVALITQSNSSPPYLLVVVPLLFEIKGFLDLVQHTLVVDCAEATQLSRAMKRSALDEQTVRAILTTQIPRAERLRRADQIIHNDNGLDTLKQQVTQLHQRYSERGSPSAA